MANDYAKALGERIRDIRHQKQMSLQAVEQKSGGKWKAVVVGSYERGDRAVTVQKLAELADFFEVPLSVLLPGSGSATPDERRPRLVIDLERLSRLPEEQAGLLVRYVNAIQRERNDYNGRVLSIRAEDLRTLAVIYDKPQALLAEDLIEWGVLNPEARKAL